eukprot:1988871-Pyramimonas_sp.AAC.1
MTRSATQRTTWGARNGEWEHKNGCTRRTKNAAKRHSLVDNLRTPGGRVAVHLVEGCLIAEQR